MNKSVCLFCRKKNIINKNNIKTIFNKKYFYLINCKECEISYISPLPTLDDLNKLYSFDDYYKKYYLEHKTNETEYSQFLNYIQPFLSTKSKILDYGCGDGSLMSFLKKKGLNISGADFESSMIQNLRNNRYDVHNYEQIKKFKNYYHLIYMIDVFEHSNDPIKLINTIFTLLNKRGILIIEGPIEKNISITNLAIRLYLFLKYKLFKIVSPQFPYHLLFYSNKQLINFIISTNKFELKKYKIYETGWPLKGKNFIKNFIAYSSILLSKILFTINFYGNRSIIIFVKNEEE
tara:strand:- start:103 stop:975 length:873 start_codon:yes stop_codon:yes gene_type:complete